MIIMMIKKRKKFNRPQGFNSNKIYFVSRTHNNHFGEPAKNGELPRGWFSSRRQFFFLNLLFYSATEHHSLYAAVHARTHPFAWCVHVAFIATRVFELISDGDIAADASSSAIVVSVALPI